MSKADLWREPLPTRFFVALPSKTFTTNFKTRAFPKKPMLLANPFPGGPWHDLYDYKLGLKCELCKTTIDQSVFPQQLQCGHVCCAECIHKHYHIENNKTCTTCAKYINEEDDPALCRACYSAPCDCARYDCYDDGCPSCGNSYCDGWCQEKPSCPSCGPGGCGDCGTLSCGCIDVCRCRCDPDEYCGDF